METISPVQVVVVSAQPLVREGLLALVAQSQGFRPEPDLQAVLTVQQPAVVVVDVGELELDDLTDLRRGCTRPHLALLAFIRDQRCNPVELAAHLGAAGVISIETSADELGESLRAAVEGRPLPVPATDGALDQLSARQVEVLRLISSGLTNLEIAREMFLGMNTIKTYIRTAYRKIGVESRTQAVLWCVEHGLGGTRTLQGVTHPFESTPAPSES